MSEYCNGILGGRVRKVANVLSLLYAAANTFRRHSCRKKGISSPSSGSR